MEDLPKEILLMIQGHLSDPSALRCTSKRIRTVTNISVTRTRRAISCDYAETGNVAVLERIWARIQMSNDTAAELAKVAIAREQYGVFDWLIREAPKQSNGQFRLFVLAASYPAPVAMRLFSQANCDLLWARRREFIDFLVNYGSIRLADRLFNYGAIHSSSFCDIECAIKRRCS
jgi:hypothetical protein